jgi:hypothetical protein
VRAAISPAPSWAYGKSCPWSSTIETRFVPAMLSSGLASTAMESAS